MFEKIYQVSFSNSLLETIHTAATLTFGQTFDGLRLDDGMLTAIWTEEPSQVLLSQFDTYIATVVEP